jgi:hypothetical protein
MSSEDTSTGLPASLSTLVLSLSATALAYMGHPLPGTPKPDKDLRLARHSIDTLEMLRAKTEGNRTEEETKLFEDLLYQLRLTFVAAEQEAGRPQPEPAEPKPAP